MMEALFSDEQILGSYFHRVTTEAELRGEERGKEQEREQSIQNLVEICQELGTSLIDAIHRIMSKYELSEDEAQRKVDLYWKK